MRPETALSNTATAMDAAPGYQRRIRIAIVDDSEVYRIFLRKTLEENPDFEVICVASNGRLALPRIRHHVPDIVILDHDMPEMNGIETLQEIRRFSDKIRVIMFSAHTVKGAKLTLDALHAGAEDFVTKPGLHAGDIENIRQVLPQKIRDLVLPAIAVIGPEALKAAPVVTHAPTGLYRFCAIGISTGGPTALRRLLPLIPAGIKGSLFIVQHLPALFTRQLAENLHEITGLTVCEAQDGMRPMPGRAYFAPGGRQMEVNSDGADAVIRVFDGPADELCKPSVNILFNSLAQNFGAETLGVIMTGMGDDGFTGMRALKRAGSYLMAQSAADCLIFGMPAKPIQDGIISAQGDVEFLARKITALLGGA